MCSIPRSLTIAETESLVEKHCQAARHAADAGYDGVLVHAVLGYLLHQFLSPRTDRRTDLYGGGDENRARFLLR